MKNLLTKKKIVIVILSLLIIIILCLCMYYYNLNQSNINVYGEIEVITTSNDINLNEITSNILTISKGGNYTLTGVLNGMIKINCNDTVTLILNEVNITNASGPAIFVQNAKQVTIYSKETTTNSLTDGDTYSIDAKGVIFSNDTLIFDGDGSLSINGKYKHGIVSNDDIIIKSGNFNITAVKDCFHANDDITIEGGIFTISAGTDGFESEGTLNVSDGNFIISAGDDGMTSAGNLNIAGGTFDITKCVEGIESKTILTISGGTISITASNDGLNAGNNISISDGNINIVSTKGDGIDSNGTINISGGYIVSFGSQQPEAGIDCDNNELVITGGTLIAAGGTSSMPTSSKCTQYIVALGSANISQEVSIKTSSGDDILSFTAKQSYSSLLISTPALQNNTTYTYTNGKSDYTFTTSSIFTNIAGLSNQPGGGNMMPQNGRPDMPNKF